MNSLKFSIAAILLVFASSASAIPLLQMYIEGATYDSVSETWVTNSTSFDIWVIANTNGPGSKGALYDVTLVATAIEGSLSDMTITGSSTSLVADPSIAADPIADVSGIGAHHSLAPHGVFTDGNAWQDFLLGDMILSDSPLGDASPTGGFPDIFAGVANSAQINVYQVELASEYTSIHFDGFGYYGPRDKFTFAPFSHDAETLAINEPIGLTLILLGFISIALTRSKMLARVKA